MQAMQQPDGAPKVNHYKQVEMQHETVAGSSRK